MKAENKGFEILAYVILGTLAAACILPFLILAAGSFTDEIAIAANGYGFIPSVFSTEAYKYMITHIATFGHAAIVSIGVTVTGTIIHTVLAATMAWPLSRTDLPGRGGLSFLVILTLLLNGGLVPTYLVYTQSLGIKNSYLALLIPTLLLNGYSIILMRGFFTGSIPDSMIEAARLDGATEWQVFTRTVIPLSRPMLTTVALMAGMAYWNDWNNGLYYLTDENKMGLQNILNNIIRNAQFLSQNVHSVSAGSAVPVETLRMAVALVSALPMVIAYIFLQRYFIAGMTMGAVKE